MDPVRLKSLSLGLQVWGCGAPHRRKEAVYGPSLLSAERERLMPRSAKNSQELFHGGPFPPDRKEQ